MTTQATPWWQSALTSFGSAAAGAAVDGYRADNSASNFGPYASGNDYGMALDRYNDVSSGSGSFWDSSTPNGNWTDLILPALTATAGLATSIPQAQALRDQEAAAAEQLAYDRQQSEADRAFELGRMLLQAQFGSGGGGGGGSAARLVPITTGTEVASIIGANAPIRQNAMDALLAGITGPLAGGRSAR